MATVSVDIPCVGLERTREPAPGDQVLRLSFLSPVWLDILRGAEIRDPDVTWRPAAARTYINSVLDAQIAGRGLTEVSRREREQTHDSREIITFERTVG